MRTNHLWSLLTFLMVAMLSMSLTACGDDDDDSSDGLSGTTWTVTVEGYLSAQTVSFTSGSTGKITYTTESDNTFQYAYMGEYGTMNISGRGFNPYTFVISGLQMSIYDNEGDLFGVFKRK